MTGSSSLAATMRQAWGCIPGTRWNSWDRQPATRGLGRLGGVEEDWNWGWAIDGSEGLSPRNSWGPAEERESFRSRRPSSRMGAMWPHAPEVPWAHSQLCPLWLNCLVAWMWDWSFVPLEGKFWKLIVHSNDNNHIICWVLTVCYTLHPCDLIYYGDPIRSLLLYPFFRVGNWGSEDFSKQSNFSKL